MAYVFFILDNGIFANGKPAPISDNYTYRLMELEATGTLLSEVIKLFAPHW